MQLPVDIKAVIDEATNIDEARRTTLSVSVYLDDSAPGDVQAHVRQAFASASPHARVSLMYLTTLPALVADIAKAQGAPIPQGDLVFPKPPKAESAVLPAPDAAAGGAEAVQALGAGSPNEPYALDGAAVGSLSERMGGWEP